MMNKSYIIQEKTVFLSPEKQDVMNHIIQNINELRLSIPSRVKIIAVSKTKTASEIREAMRAGQIVFGESKVQELIAKHEQIPEAAWHFIGHLQTNKIKYMAPFVQMIHSVDSFRVLEEIDRQASKCNRIIDCLLQIDIAREETKFGLGEQEVIELLNHSALPDLRHVRICGLMGIATFTDDTEVIRSEFRDLANFFKRIRRNYFPADPFFCELSMGMSDDYMIAIEEGATMVRIGSAIFGKRTYQEKNVL
jgi:pyridoxal phosphate enzyme (YggS family)